MKKILLIIVFLIAGINGSFASHIPGGNITWTCDPNNPLCYTIIFTQIINCPSTNPATMSSGFTITNSCGLANPVMPVLNQVGVSIDVAQTCPTATSTCAGGTVPGAWLATYEGTVCFPANCDSWTIDYELCCRDANSNTAGGSSNSMHLQSIMNTLTAPCNNGPVVTSSPIPYMCANQTNTYCLTVADPDADSTYYQMTSPLGAGGVPIAYNAPYSVNSPLTGFVLDPVTGCMTFNQATTGNFVVAINILSYDAFGNLISSVTQDYQFEIIACSNTAPNQPVGGGISNFNGTGGNGGATQTGPAAVSMCYGDNACFDVVFNDPDISNILTITTDGTTLMPGATFTQTGTNPATGTFCWTAQPGFTGNVVTFVCEDDACPITGTTSFSVNFNITTGVYTGPNDTICGNQSSALFATGGSGVYTWSAISGPPINVGTNFSCNPCANPTASPTATTTYVVTSTLSAACQNTDTVTVYVVPDFTPTASQSTPSACLFDPIQLNTTVVPASAGYTYQWSPSAYLSATNIPNPVANITVPGTYTYIVDVTSPNGCIKSDTINVTIVPFVAPNVTILTPDSLMQCGDSIAVVLDLGGGIPALCGPSPTNACSQPPTNTTVGTATGANTSTTWPAPYGNWYRNAKHQFLFTAAELNGMGIMGGKITELAWDVTQINGTTSYTGYTISMGCTQTTSLTTWETGLTQVFNPVNYTIAVGTNVHVLDQAYEWDGVSNLVIEVCYNNLSQNYTNNSITPYTTTTFNSSYYFYSDGTPACPYLSPSTSSTNRPVTRFTWCPTIPDPNAFNYAWTPNTNILSSNIQNPTVFPSIPTTYIVTVTDTGGNCFDTDTLNVSVLCGACYQPTVTITNPTCKDGTNGSIVIDPTFVFGSEVQSFTWKDSISGAVLQTTLNLSAGMMDSLTNIGAGAYTISMVDSSGCSQDTTVYLTEPDSVTISTITANDIVCIGGTKQINATAIGGNGGPYSYTWTDLSIGTNIPGNGPHTVSPIVSPTCYSVFATDPLGCVSSSSQVCISLYPNLIASTNNDTLTVCPGFGTNIDMSAIGGSGVGYNYNWYENGTLVGNGAVINVTPTSSPTTYLGVVTDNCTTPADTIPVVVNWHPLVVPDFVRNKPDSCYPITIEFANTSTPSALIGSSVWTFSNNPTLNGDTVSSTFTTPVCQDVTLTVTTVDGCIVDTTFADFVCPYDYPVANYYMTPPITDLLNTEITFTNLSGGGVPPLTYLWNFNSGLSPDTSVATNPVFVYPNNVPGNYPILLTVTDANGCVDTTMGTLIINGIYLFYVPNTFTPDGDGTNEVFRPYGEGIDFTQYTMQIFNRWGELIYETGNAERGWDGTYKGKPAQIGTYVWKIVAKEEYSTIIHDNYGHVNLIR